MGEHPFGEGRPPWGGNSLMSIMNSLHTYSGTWRRRGKTQAIVVEAA